MRKKLRWAAFVATLAVMALIFYLSAQEGPVSGTLSDTVMDQMQDAGLQVVIPGLFSSNIYANVRKWAHVYIYCALGACMASTFCLWSVKSPVRRRALWAVVACFAYAASDEIHQYFVPGRAMMWEDVFVDAAGFVPCVLLTCLLFWCRQQRKKSREEAKRKTNTE